MKIKLAKNILLKDKSVVFHKWKFKHFRLSVRYQIKAICCSTPNRKSGVWLVHCWHLLRHVFMTAHLSWCFQTNCGLPEKLTSSISTVFLMLGGSRLVSVILLSKNELPWLSLFGNVWTASSRLHPLLVPL